MKITKRKLKQIIKEEMQKALREQPRAIDAYTGGQSKVQRPRKQRRPRQGRRRQQQGDEAAEIAQVVANVVKQLNDILIRLKGGP